MMKPPSVVDHHALFDTIRIPRNAAHGVKNLGIRTGPAVAGGPSGITRERA